MTGRRGRPRRLSGPAGATGAAFLLLAATGCGAPPPDALAPDLIYHGGKVVTVDPDFTIARAVAVRDGRIVAVGADAEVLALAGRRTERIDLGGRTVLPGFYDNHIHLGPGRELQEWEGGLVPAVPEWTRGVKTAAQLHEALRERATETPPGEWIRGGLTRMDFPNQTIPDRWDLDEAAPDHPVLLTRGPHTWLLNSRALELAGIGPETPSPEGGEVLKDDEGRPTGRLMDAAKRLAADVVPEEDAGAPLSDDAAIESMRRMLRRLVALGITSVNVAGIRPEGLGLVQELYERHGGELPRATVQIRGRPGYDAYDDLEVAVRETIEEIEALGWRSGLGSERLKMGAIKMSVDGGLSAPVFWSTEPYESRPDFTGVVRIPAESFAPVARRAHELGWQLGIHAMGDAAAVMVVDEIAGILGEMPREDHRHYLHHVAVKPPEETIRTMAENGIGVASQPAFTVGLGAYAVEALSGRREQTMNPTKSLLDEGVWVSWGSDSAPYGPLISIWTGVTRTGWDGDVYGPDEAVDVETAVRLHTLAPAYQTFDEDERGSIEPGKVADFVVLGEDILSVEPDRIREIPVEMVVIGGEVVHGDSRGEGS